MPKSVLHIADNQDFMNGFSKAILLHSKTIAFSFQKDNFHTAKVILLIWFKILKSFRNKQS